MSTLAANKRARFDYDLIEEYEGGLKLRGAEVKSARKGNVRLQGAYLMIQNNELWVRNMHIGRYQPAGAQEDYDPTRDRKVLVHRKELRGLVEKKHAQGLTLVPLKVYTKGDLIKISFAVARGKRNHEKRDAIKKRDIDKRMKEEMKKTRYA